MYNTQALCVHTTHVKLMFKRDHLCDHDDVISWSCFLHDTLHYTYIVDVLNTSTLLQISILITGFRTKYIVFGEHDVRNG